MLEDLGSNTERSIKRKAKEISQQSLTTTDACWERLEWTPERREQEHNNAEWIRRSVRPKVHDISPAALFWTYTSAEGRHWYFCKGAMEQLEERYLIDGGMANSRDPKSGKKQTGGAKGGKSKGTLIPKS